MMESSNKSVDEELQHIYSLHPLQDKVIAYRTSKEPFKKLYRATCERQLKNLANLEIDIVATELKLPDLSKQPSLNDVLIANDCVDILMNELKNTKACMDLLSEKYN